MATFMRVLNGMLSEGHGGLEFAFAHYADALQMAGAEVVCCVAPHASIKQNLTAGIQVIDLPHCSQFDPRAILRAARLIREVRPDVLLAHGQRAYTIFLRAQRLFGKTAPLVQVLHRPRFKNVNAADHTITVSKRLREQAIERGADPARVSHIPNFLTHAAAATPERAWQTPPVIGALGRMVPEKGMDLFLEALAILKHRAVPFRAIIGGNGQFQDTLHAHAAALGLGPDTLQWLGWVDDNATFYNAIDIFCLPSREESFGLVVLEAFAHGKPVVATRTFGPSELITEGKNGLFCAIDAESIADGLMRLLQNPALGAELAARASAESIRYRMETVAPMIGACVNDIRRRFLTVHEAA